MYQLYRRHCCSECFPRVWVGVEVWLHTFLSWALYGGERQASRPGSFTFKERAPGAHPVGGLMGPELLWKFEEKERL